MTARKKKPTRKKAVTRETAVKKVATKKVATKKSATKSKSTSQKTTARKPSARNASPKPVSVGTRNARSGGRTKGVGSGAKIAMTGLPWVIAVALGSVLMLRTRDSEGEPAGAPELTPQPQPVPAPTPLPVEPPKPDVSNQDRLNIDYRRAKQAEIPRDIIQKAKNYTREPMGAIHFVKSADGRNFAYVLEQHSNLAKGDAGVSVFIER